VADETGDWSAVRFDGYLWYTRWPNREWKNGWKRRRTRKRHGPVIEQAKGCDWGRVVYTRYEGGLMGDEMHRFAAQRSVSKGPRKALS